MNKIFKVYKITNLVNNKIYIGQTSMKIKERWYFHKRYNDCDYIHNAIRKYGPDNFKIEWIASSLNEKYIDDLEDYFIRHLNTIAPNGYNLKYGGSHPTMSDITKEKMSKIQIEKYSKMTKEAKKESTKHLLGYIEQKKRPIIGINFNHETIEFPTINSAYEQGIYAEISLKDQYTRCGGYIFFYKGEYTLEQMIEIVEKATITKVKRANSRKIKFRESMLEINNKKEDNKITAVNPFTKDVIHYRNINDAVEQGVAASAVVYSLKPTEAKITRHKGYHFFYTSKHTINEMFKLAEERNELIRQRFLAGRKKFSISNQKNINAQKKPIIGINTKTLEYKIFESGMAAKKEGYSIGAFNLALKGMKRRTKGMHFQYYTKSIEEHIEFVKELYS